MALKSGRCGSKTVQYEATCTFTCFRGTLTMSDGSRIPYVRWTIKCGGTVVGSGTIKPRVRPKQDTIYVDGLLSDIAESLAEHWGRLVTVPRGMSRQRVTLRARGTPEQMAEALGLKLGT